MNTAKRLLIAASGTGGHIFPALAVAEQLPQYDIEWLGVPDRLEKQLVPSQYPLHFVDVEGLQKRGFATVSVLAKFVRALFQVRSLLKTGQFDGVFTTGGYIAAPAVIAARSVGIPALLHESNALPGKVTRFLSPWCDGVAIGFADAATFLPRARKVVWVGTPVRTQFLQVPPPPLTDLPIPPDVLLLAIVGGSQGAVAVNKLVRDCAPVWLEAGIWIIHQTGENDPDVKQLTHPHYFPLPFYSNMAGLLHRADLVIGRSGAGTLTELSITHTPSILIPYPFAADDHQTYNANVFVHAGAAQLFQQKDLTVSQLQQDVLRLMIEQPDELAAMKTATAQLAVPDSAQKLAHWLNSLVGGRDQ